MARKYLQMGFTRSRRYANRRSGRKYETRDVGKARAKRPLEPDAEKAESATIFYEVWQRAEKDRVYAAWRKSHPRAESPPRVVVRSLKGARRPR